METINEMCELTPPCECDCNPDKDLSQGNIRPNYSPSPCGADSGVCGEHILEHPLHLWAIKYGVEGHLKFIGVAVVQAPTRSAAECIFAKNSLFSGTPERLKILAMKEVMPWSEPILFEDCAAIIDKRNLKSYPFLLKSDYEHNIQNISDNVIEAVEDYIEHNPIQQVQSNWEETDETSKAYILNKPEIPAEQVNADWNSESGKSQILNKPTDLVHTSDIEGLLRNDGSVYTGKYLEQVRDLDNFQASEGKIVQYIGETNAKYTNGYIYKKVGTEIVIPAGTFYYSVDDSTQLMVDVAGLRNGMYFRTEPDEVSANIIIPDFWALGSLSSGTLGYFPVKVDTQRHTITPLADVGDYIVYNGEVKQIKAVYRNTTRFDTQYYTGFSGCLIEGNILCNTISFYTTGNPILQDKIKVYKNEYGDKLYIYYNATNRPIALRKYNDKYYTLFDTTANWVSGFSAGNTTSEIVIGTEEWQQWDVQPREDASHYVTDSEIGWIEH